MTRQKNSDVDNSDRGIVPDLLGAIQDQLVLVLVSDDAGPMSRRNT